MNQGLTVQRSSLYSAKKCSRSNRRKKMPIPFFVSDDAMHSGTGRLTSIYNTCKRRDVSKTSRTKNTHKSRNPTSGQLTFTMHLPLTPEYGNSQLTNPKITTGWPLTPIRPRDILLLLKFKSTLKSKNLVYRQLNVMQ